jgi:hypothetical protein
MLQSIPTRSNVTRGWFAFQGLKTPFYAYGGQIARFPQLWWMNRRNLEPVGEFFMPPGSFGAACQSFHSALTLDGTARFFRRLGDTTRATRAVSPKPPSRRIAG